MGGEESFEAQFVIKKATDKNKLARATRGIDAPSLNNEGVESNTAPRTEEAHFWFMVGTSRRVGHADRSPQHDEYSNLFSMNYFIDIQ